ncbi:MAG: hypothetical protein PHT77_11605, partial [Bacteroidales bacterium]|nr:hypothetical protein [Bacteroidales bacterium]
FVNANDEIYIFSQSIIGLPAIQNTKRATVFTIKKIEASSIFWKLAICRTPPYTICMPSNAPTRTNR